MFKRLSALVVATLMMAASTTVLAAYTYVSTGVFGRSFLPPPSPIWDGESLESTSGAPLTSLSSIVARHDYWSLSAESRAHVEPALIQLYASTNAEVSFGPIYYSRLWADSFAGSKARWRDTLTIDGGALNGTVGHLLAGFWVNGTFDWSYDPSLFHYAGSKIEQGYYVSLQLSNKTGTGQSVFKDGGVRDFFGDGRRDFAPYTRDLSPYTRYVPPGLWTIELDFTFGTPIEVDMYGDIFSSSYAIALLSYADIRSTIDFSHTIYWGGFLDLRDAYGNFVSDYSVISESGFDYRFPAVVPVPGAWMLLLSALGLLGVHRKTTV